MRVQINHAHQWLRQMGAWTLTAMAIAVLAMPLIANRHAAAAEAADHSDFNIQVSPSPLAVTLTPGKAQSATLSVRNFSNHSETLYPRLNGFTIDKKGKDIKLLETVPANMAAWVSFTEETLTLPAGGSKQITIVFNTPHNVGFSYSAAITLARSPNAQLASDGVRLRGSVAVFCLVNINRPDAKASMAVSGLRTDKSQYQFLPASFTLDVENKGNVIGQPAGSVFIQRSFSSEKPIATLPINPGNNYVLPGTVRGFDASWKNGFPSYITGADGKQHLSWDWKRLNELRFGRYVAKAVVVYSDGKRDVPVVTTTSFWVIPWALIIGVLLFSIILITGILSWGRLLFKGTRKVRTYAIRRK